MLVPGAAHNQSLYGPGVWGEVERWIEEALELRERRMPRDVSNARLRSGAAGALGGNQLIRGAGLAPIS